MSAIGKQSRRPSGRHVWVNDISARDPDDLDRVVRRCKACGTLDTWELAREACPMERQYLMQQKNRAFIS